jgi:hypothetical protein
MNDPDARLYRNCAGKDAKLCFISYALMENCNALLVYARLTKADGHAERVGAPDMIEPHADHISKTVKKITKRVLCCGEPLVKGSPANSDSRAMSALLAFPSRL